MDTPPYSSLNLDSSAVLRAKFELGNLCQGCESWDLDPHIVSNLRGPVLCPAHSPEQGASSRAPSQAWANPSADLRVTKHAVVVVISFDPHLGTMRQSRKWDSHFTDRETEAQEGCDLPRLSSEDRAAFDDNPVLLILPEGSLHKSEWQWWIEITWMEPGITMSSWFTIHSAITTVLHSSSS